MPDANGQATQQELLQRQRILDILGANAATLNPVLAAQFLPQTQMDQLATVGPEDAGKTNLRLLPEQALGKLGQAASFPARQVGKFVDYLGQSPVPQTPAAPPPPVATPQTPTDVSALGAGPQSGFGPGGGGQLSQMLKMLGIPDNGGVMPQAPQAGGVNVNALLSGVNQAPISAPTYETVDRPNPIAPDTTALEHYLGEVQKNAPTNPASESPWMRLAEGLAAGAAQGNQRPSQLLGRAAVHVKQAEEDYRAQKMQYDGVVLQGQQQLANLHQQYAQAVQDTQTGNATQQAEARNRAKDVGVQLAQHQQQFGLQVAQLKAGVAETNAQLAASSAHYQFAAQLQNQQMRAQILTSMIRAHAMGGGSNPMTNLRVQDALLKPNGAPPALQGEVRRIRTAQAGRPDIALADSLLPYASSILPNYDKLVTQFAGEAAKQGLSPANPAAYHNFIADKLTQALLAARITDPGNLDQLSQKGFVWADRYKQIVEGAGVPEMTGMDVPDASAADALAAPVE